jgi:hypothetical protein
MKRRGKRFEPVLGGVDCSGGYVTAEGTAAPQTLWAVDDVQRGSIPGAVRLLRESAERERSADADSNEGDARDACID